MSPPADLVAAVESAVRSLKIPHQAAAPIDGSPERAAVRRGGMTISARWQPADTTTGDALTLRAVAAMAASLALPAMASESAAQLAEAEGLVTHLTSLILIDEAASQEVSIPATRKVALPTPGTNAMLAGMLGLSEMSVRASQEMFVSSERRLQASRRHYAEPMQNVDLLFSPSDPVFSLADAIGWDQAPDRLQTGDLTDLDPAIAREICDFAARADIISSPRSSLSIRSCWSSASWPACGPIIIAPLPGSLTRSSASGRAARSMKPPRR